MIRVVVIARTPAGRIGLRSLLESDPDVTVLADATSLELIEADPQDTDVIVCDDLELEDVGAQVGSQGPALVMLGMLDRRVVPRLLADQRPFALLSPDVDSDQLVAAVKAVATGLTVFAPDLVHSSLAAGREAPGDEGGDDLTPREREVLQLVAVGLPNKTIARRLELSDHTVKFHIASVFSKLGASSRTEAVALAARRGLITL